MATPIVLKETYNANPDQVWKAITDREEMKDWYFDIPDFELEEGAVFNFFEPGDKREFHHRAVITEIIPKKKLQHTWTYPSLSKGKSILTWEVLESGVKTSVVLTHEGIESFSDGGKDFIRENFIAGWNEILGKSLKEFLENQGRSY